MHGRECNRVLLAGGGFAVVEQCNCGAIHLTIGALTLRLAPEALAQLAEVIGQAACEQALAELRATRTTAHALS